MVWKIRGMDKLTSMAMVIFGSWWSHFFINKIVFWSVNESDRDEEDEVIQLFAHLK